MKNIFKNIFLLILGVIVLQGCDSGQESRWAVTPTSGWVEFRSASTTTGQTSPLVTVPIDIKVPVYPNGFNISYEMTAVEGDFTQYVSQTSGTLFVDPVLTEPTRIADLDIPLVNMEAGRNFVTSFDITITSTSSGIGVGVDDTSITTHRVTIPCSNPDVLPSDYFVGDYEIADVTATIGPGNGTQNIGSGVVTLSVDPNNPNRRLFQAQVLPAFTGGALYDFSIEFDVDNDVVSLGGFTGSGISCSGPEYGYTGAAADASGPWDVCNDESITIQYVEDPLVGCGGPYAASFSLTKVN